MKKVLIVVAHPDDEVLGCGGTVARLVKEGNAVHTLILGEGAASRYDGGSRGRIDRKIKELKENAKKANKILGVRNVFLFDFPDNRFDVVALLDIIKTVEKTKEKVRPDVIYTHHREDLNIDHRIVYDAVLTACRPLKGETVKEIYSFAVPSSTEWYYPGAFAPNQFVDVSDTIDIKIKAFEVYKDEVRRFPHPRSKECIKAWAISYGCMAGLKCAEAFKVIRCVI